MSLITCLDIFGKTHYIRSDKIIKRKAVYGIYLEDKSVLMVQDSKGKNWHLPGGGMEKGETDFNSLSREFQEETGYEIFPNIKLTESFFEYFFDLETKQAWLTHRFFYSVTAVSEAPIKNGTTTDVSQAKFIDTGNLDQYPIPENIKKIILTSS